MNSHTHTTSFLTPLDDGTLIRATVTTVVEVIPPAIAPVSEVAFRPDRWPGYIVFHPAEGGGWAWACTERGHAGRAHGWEAGDESDPQHEHARARCVQDIGRHLDADHAGWQRQAEGEGGG